MPSYILRDIPADLWVRVRERAQKDGRHLRGLLLWLLTKYADGEIT